MGTLGAMDRSILWHAALALTLPRSFFEDWGAVAGPAGRIAASLVTMRVLGLPQRRVAVASAVAGGLAALLGAVAAHAVSLPVAVVTFALICAARPAPRPARATARTPA